MTIAPRTSQILLVGQKIRQIRKSRHLTQAELAHRIGVTQSDLSRMENGEYKVGLDTLFKILQVFELSMAGFFEESMPDVSEADDKAPEISVSGEEEQVIADLAALSPEARREVRDFIQFKRQQESRLPRWKSEPESTSDGSMNTRAAEAIPLVRPARRDGSISRLRPVPPEAPAPEDAPDGSNS